MEPKLSERDKKIRDLTIKVIGYYDGIDDRLLDALKKILALLDKPDPDNCEGCEYFAKLKAAEKALGVEGIQEIIDELKEKEIEMAEIIKQLTASLYEG